MKIELTKILDETNRKQIFKDYQELKMRLGGAGASAKTAQLIVNSIK